MQTILFVHGAFQGGWVWKDVSRHLERTGYQVHRPTLSECGYLGRGETRTTGLNTYIHDICSYVEMEDLDDFTIVAHSYSGMICSGVMIRMQERIRSAIFLDAVIPEQDVSFAQLAGDQFMGMLEQHRLGETAVSPWPLKVFGVHGDASASFQSRLRPFPMQAFLDPFPESFQPRAVRTTFVTCTETVSGFIRAMAEKAKNNDWPLHSIPSGHCPMITCPEKTAGLIAELL